MPTWPSASPAYSTLAVLPPASEETKLTGWFAGPWNFMPVCTVDWTLGSVITGVPRPVAYTVMVSPGWAGLLAVIGAPCTLAQQSAGVVAVMITCPPALEEAEY